MKIKNQIQRTFQGLKPVAMIFGSLLLVLIAPSTAFADGIDSYTKLMLHADGTNGSTTFTDSSGTGKTATANGNAQISTSQSKFGGSSGYFDGNADYLELADSADWAFGTNNMTIDFWFKTPADGTIFWQGPSNGWAPTTAFYIQISSGKLIFSPDYRNYPGHHPITSTQNVNDNTWHHAAIVRDGGYFRMYVDGTETGTAVNMGTDFSMTDSAYGLWLTDRCDGTTRELFILFRSFGRNSYLQGNRPLDQQFYTSVSSL